MIQKQTVFQPSREEVLYRRYAPQIFTYLLRHLSSQQDAEDLLVEVFLALLEKPSSMELEEQRCAAYLQAIARNKLANYYRQKGGQQFVPLEEIAETTHAPEQVMPEPSVLAHERQAHLRQTVGALPALQQKILHLRFVHGLPHGEIATLLAKSEGAVRMILSRTLKQLRSFHPDYQER